MFYGHNHRVFWLGGLLLVLAAIAAANMANQNTETTESQTTDNVEGAKEIQIRGGLVCLAEAMHDLYRADLPTNHDHLYGFKTTDGEFYTLLRTNLSEALFVDERLRKKTLIITGRTFPKTHLLEAIRLQSVYDGGLHDLYYYCEPVRYVPLRRGIVCVVRHLLNWSKSRSNLSRSQISRGDPA